MGLRVRFQRLSLLPTGKEMVKRELLARHAARI